jgi:hypothetical protein
LLPTSPPGRRLPESTTTGIGAWQRCWRSDHLSFYIWGVPTATPDPDGFVRAVSGAYLHTQVGDPVHVNALVALMKAAYGAQLSATAPA